MKGLRHPSRRRCLAGGAVALLWTAVGVPSHAEQRFPDVVRVEVRASGADRFDFDVTVSSPYDTPARYADAFRVMAPGGTVFGERKLLHDHQGEQPFTRDLYGVVIPPGIDLVIVQARDQKFGYGGKSMQVRLPKR